MRIVYGLMIAVVAATPALAGAVIRVPEMDAGAGIGALALLIGAAAIIREKFFRK